MVSGLLLCVTVLLNALRVMFEMNGGVPMSSDSKRRILQVVVFFMLSVTACANGDVAATYQSAMREIKKFERALTAELSAKNINAFLSHFDVPEAEAREWRGSLNSLVQSWTREDLDRLEVHLPLLAAQSKKVFTFLGHIDVHMKDGSRTKHGLPPCVLSRRDGEWVVASEALSQLQEMPCAEVARATFDVTPLLDENGLSANAVITVENKTDQSLERIPIHIRYPLNLMEAKLNGKPFEADVTWGEIDGRAAALIAAHVNPPLKPGGSATFAFNYEVSYAHHDLGRKPVGFTADRGFILWEAGWYPHFDREWQQFPYEMVINVPRGYKALTGGNLVADHGDGKRHSFSFRTDRSEAPFILWGRYKETPCTTGQTDMVIWTPIAGDIDPKPMANLVSEAYAAFESFLPPPSLKRHRVVAVTRYGGYGPMGNLLLHDPTFDKSNIDKSGTLDFVAHELSHSWVNSLAAPHGNPPSLLAEGLATYLGAKAVERSRGEQAAREVWRDNRKHFSQAASRVGAPMELTEELRLRDNPAFRAVAYYKGAYLFRELESLVGEKIVLQALRDLLQENKGDRFTLEDFIKRVDRLAGRKLTPFWRSFLHEAIVPDYAIEFADAGKSLAKFRVVNHGQVSPTPVEVVAYDDQMREIAREKVVMDSKASPLVVLAEADRVAHVAVDPDLKILQAETRNDRYPECMPAKEDRDAVKEIMNHLFACIREGEVGTLSAMLTKDTNVLAAAKRQQMVAAFNRSLPLQVTKKGPVNIYRAGEGRVDVTVKVRMDVQGESLNRLGEFTLVKETGGWKLVTLKL